MCLLMAKFTVEMLSEQKGTLYTPVNQILRFNQTII